MSLVLAILSIRDRTLTPSGCQKLSRIDGLAMVAVQGQIGGSQPHAGWLRWRQRSGSGPKPYCESAFDMYTTLVDLYFRQLPVSPVQSVPENHRAPELSREKSSLGSPTSPLFTHVILAGVQPRVSRELNQNLEINTQQTREQSHCFSRWSSYIFESCHQRLMS